MLTKEQIFEVASSVVETLASKEGGLHTKAPAAFGTFTPLHGINNVGAGIFSRPIERDVISTLIRPLGIAEVLPWFGSNTVNPLYAALTGVSDDLGTEPAYPCSDAPSGYMKACELSAQFGRVMRDSETIDIDEVFEKINRGDFTDLRLIGNIFGNGNSLLPSGMSADQILNLVTMSQMFQTGIRSERKWASLLWSGNPANNNAGGGYKEPPGLSLQVATGQKDWSTGTLCPSLDSDVKDFNKNNVDGTDGNDIVEYMSMVEYFVRSLAVDTGVMPVQWVWAMRPQLFEELTAVWPCLYNTNKCGAVGGDNARVITDGRENVAQRDRMRQNKTIEVNGITYQVVLDSAIPELNSTNAAGLLPGEYASSVYFLPISMVGGMPVTYIEYKDYRMASADIARLRGKERFWTDDGRFMWGYEDVGAFCYKLKLKSELRVILRTPHLAGRIDNVKYSPLQHLRDYDPDSPYYANGGPSFRTPESGNSVWLGQ